MRLKELSDILGAALDGPGDADITGVAGIQDANKGQVTYIIGTPYLKDLARSHASAAIVPLDTPSMHLPLLRVKNPRLAFARTLALFHGKHALPTGISDKAVIGANVVVGADCSIHPFAILADNVRIGDRVTIYPGVHVGQDSVISDDSLIYPNVCIGHGVSIGKRVVIHAGTVIGSDGFGFVTEGGVHHKIPQVGGVVVENDVEIGSNCTVDRATLGNTLIRKGSKIDNLVQIAHNVTIGEHCLLAAQAGIAGSTTLGNYVVFAGQVGVGDHLSIGDRVMVGGGTGITRDIEPGQVVAGYHAMPLRDWLKVQVVLPKLPELKKLVSKLEKQLLALKGKSN